MKGNGIKNWWQGLSSNQKFFVAVFAIILLWILYRQFRGIIDGFGNTVQAGGTLATLQTQGIKPSYDSASYSKWADRLEFAMAGVGTDEEIIYNIYRYMKNDADVVKLNQAFGIRDDETLNGWLKGDLSQDIISKINETLRDKGISKTIK